jgi:hypothetical protein
MAKHQLQEIQSNEQNLATRLDKVPIRAAHHT